MKTIPYFLAAMLWLGSSPIFAAEKAEPGLLAEYFSFDDSLEDFPTIGAAKKPVLKRVDKTIDVESTAEAWPHTDLLDHFYIRWTGKLRAPTEGKYKFFLESDDGSRLYLDGKQVVDNGGLHGMDEKSGEVQLKEGEQL